MYESAAWLEEVIADLSDKWIIAQPMSTGDVWSYICEPLRLNISVADAISPNRAQVRQELQHHTMHVTGGVGAGWLARQADDGRLLGWVCLLLSEWLCVCAAVPGWWGSIERAEGGEWRGGRGGAGQHQDLEQDLLLPTGKQAPD